MQRRVRVQRKDGLAEVIGIAISEGPVTLRVLVTDPYHQQGQIVEIPHDEIESVADSYTEAGEEE